MRSYSIKEFCALHGCSRNFYYQMEKDGTGPKTFPLGRHRRISEEANAEWVRSLEAIPRDPETVAKKSAQTRSARFAREDRQAVQP